MLLSVCPVVLRKWGNVVLLMSCSVVEELLCCYGTAVLFRY